MRLRHTTLFCAIAFLSACASVGVKVDSSKLLQFHKGETTYDEVIAALGKPTQVTLMGNGGKTLIYSYASSQARPETFIPIVGAFVGGADTESSLVMLMFDKNDLLQNYTASQGSTGTGTGFEALSQSRNTAQPREAK